MHAPCQFVPQAARRTKEACFQGLRRCKIFFPSPDAGEAGLTTSVAATGPSAAQNRAFARRKPTFHQAGDLLPSLVTPPRGRFREHDRARPSTSGPFTALSAGLTKAEFSATAPPKPSGCPWTKPSMAFAHLADRWIRRPRRSRGNAEGFHGRHSSHPAQFDFCSFWVAAEVALRVGRGCPRPVAGRSLRASGPSLTRMQTALRNPCFACLHTPAPGAWAPLP